LTWIENPRGVMIDLRELLTFCPRCGGIMVLQLPPPDDRRYDPFYGCSEFDAGCRGSRDINDNGDPVTDAELQEIEDIKAEIRWRKLLDES
jgi:hypothetical protein